MGRRQLQAPQAVKIADLLADPVQDPLRNILLRVNHHLYAAAFRMDIRSSDSRLRKRGSQLFRRLIVPEHIK